MCDLSVAPGQRRLIVFDLEKVNFSELVVRDSTGTYCSLIFDPVPLKDGFVVNKHRLTEIENISNLPRTTPEVIASMDRSRGGGKIFWSLAIAGLVAPFLFFAIRRELWRLSSPAAPAISKVALR